MAVQTRSYADFSVESLIFMAEKIFISNESDHTTQTFPPCL